MSMMWIFLSGVLPILYVIGYCFTLVFFLEFFVFAAS